MSAKRKQYGHGKCSFREEWLSDRELETWLMKKPGDIYSAKCKFCPSSLISLSSMGRQALTSHMKSQKHSKAVSMMVSSQSMSSFVKIKKDLSNVTCSPSTSSMTKASTSTSPPITSYSSSSEQTGMKRFILNENVTKAEILWAVHTVMTHTSFRSAALAVETFKLMFSDSGIADKIQLHRIKVGYLIVFGLAPYFKNNLISAVEQSSCFVISFDESMNKVSSKQQMDIVVRFWDSVKDEVSTRYLTSAFLHSAKAVDLQEALISNLKPLKIENIIQISMDGPNVNKKMLRDLKVYISEQGIDRKLIDFGSCGIHSIHNAFKVGIRATEWNILSFLRAIYNHFKYSPSRRGDYIRHVNSNIFPKKFCAVRWLENVDVAQTAIDILPNLKIYVQKTLEDKKKSASVCNSSFKTIVDNLKDPMLGPKLAVFKTLAADLEPFLREFQTNWPYVPFLHSSLSNISTDVMKRFVRPEKIKTGVILNDEENLLSYKYVDLGFLTRSEIRKVPNVKEIDLSLLRKEAKKCMKTIVTKIEESSPLQYPVTKYFTCLDPKVAVREEGQPLFHKLLETLVDSCWISGTKADVVSRQFDLLVKTDSFINNSLVFQKSETRLDHFWIEEIKMQESKFKELKEVLVKVFILSHGNADVERGFSINKECLVENQKESSLIGIRTVYDGVSAEGGIHNLSLTKSMIHYARNANAKYKETLGREKLHKEETKTVDEERKRKKILLNELTSKKAKLLEDASRESAELNKQIEELKKLL